ncbi:hypothetical protein [Streptomyces sp. Ru87]|uniref:hypothetical protein n=1 Tax=Streptomyces sp. Ru87 TaxID=2044307 RepID=UPI000BF4B62E|nr:hypothetical protein [Streptomyces sp. Ru87]PGH48776.1 hypothetical protein CRI70_21245 [Streptomyces sp. Ru87]
MAAARKTTRKAKPADREPRCPTCLGTGWDSEPIYVGPLGRHRKVGNVEAICSRCLGSGIDPTPDRF